MELFTTVDVIGQGLPLFAPKGTKMIMKLPRWMEDLEDNEWGYVRTRTPLMAKSDLYKISGHWDHYKDLGRYFYMRLGKTLQASLTFCSRLCVYLR